MKLKCLIGLHRWSKLGGPHNVGGGKFKQSLICVECKKTKQMIS